jgi:hypothetical protein
MDAKIIWISTIIALFLGLFLMLPSESKRGGQGKPPAEKPVEPRIPLPKQTFDTPRGRHKFGRGKKRR